MFSHVVLFRLHDPARIPETAAILRGMAGKVPSLRTVEVGIDTTQGPRSSHLALVTRFDDEAGYKAYAVHPEHKKVLEHMAQVTAEARVVDWTG